MTFAAGEYALAALYSAGSRRRDARRTPDRRAAEQSADPLPVA
jgi:hypothetical protein